VSDSPDVPPSDLDHLSLDVLDQIGLWAAAVDGAELIDPTEHDNNPVHGVNYPHEMGPVETS
jgi:hypothetical protein